MQLIAVRHGETEENRARVMAGHSNGILSIKGRAQARKLEQILKHVRIDAIVSSDLGRAKETITGVAKDHNLRVIYTKSLRDQDYGIFQGKPHTKFIAAVKASGLGPDFRPKGGESFSDMKRRVARFVKRLEVHHKDETVLLSTHSGVIRCLWSVCLHVPLEKAMKMPSKNANFLEITIDDAAKQQR